VDRIDLALARGASFLLRKQGEDGAFRSGSYAAFRDGYSLTPMAILALSLASDTAESRRAYARGATFMTTMLGADRMLRTDLARPQYPSYSTALAILALNPSPDPAHRAARDALIGELRKLAVPSGGWGYEIGEPQIQKTANLSATLFAIGALTLSGVPQNDAELMKARAFVEKCQNAPPAGDGGFFFAPGGSDGNKAGPGQSYGSMTADGVRALIRLGVPVTDPRLVAARGWLEKEFDATRNPGAFPEVSEIRRASSYYYYMWSVSHALRDLGVTTPWYDALAEELIRRQKPDGSWQNPAAEMRENEPVVATSFAMAALAVSRMAKTGQYRSHAAVPAPPR
jgi:hypothetical protein